MASVIPYLCVDNTRAAIRWYHDAFGATVIGRPIEMNDGTIGSAEVAIFGARVVLSDPSAYARAAAPDPAHPSAVKLHMTVPDCDACVTRCRRAGAVIEREPTDSRYGRGAAVLDPFGHRWLIVQPAPTAGSASTGPAPEAARHDRQRPTAHTASRSSDGISEGAGWRAAAPMPAPYPLPRAPLDDGDLPTSLNGDDLPTSRLPRTPDPAERPTIAGRTHSTDDTRTGRR